jgi:hypothetical protein
VAAPVTVKLDEPIEFGSETISELTIRSPKAKDMRGLPMEGANIGHILDLVAKLCGQPPSVIDELGTADLLKVSEHVANFIPAGLAIGKKRSR